MASLDFEKEKTLFREYYSENQRLFIDAEIFFRSLVGSLLSTSTAITAPTIIGRVKDREESIKKFVRKYQSDLEAAKFPYEIRDHITDLIGVRAVCLYEDEVEKIAEVLAGNFDVLEVTDKIKALESTEDEFGYKGLHLDLKINDKRRALPEYARFSLLRFEVQIRTIVQDAWSVLDHKIKYKKSIPAELKRRINVLSALFELADREFRQIRDATDAELLYAPDETTEAETEASRTSAPGSELNAFTFLKIARHFFKDVEFDAQKVDLFVDDMRAWSPGITRARFNTLMRETIATVKRYKQFYEAQNPEGSFNPFTVIRHCLYLGDRQAFRRALRNSSREAFEAWLQENPTLI